MTEPIFVMHENPIGREAPYYMARVDLSYAGLGGQVEQLWLNDEGSGSFRVACVPFCAYGLSYGDRVRLDDRGEYVASIEEKSGNRALRALLAPSLGDVEAQQIRAILENVAVSLGIPFELHGERFIAFNIDPGIDVDILVDAVSVQSGEGTLFREWGDLREFQPQPSH